MIKKEKRTCWNCKNVRSCMIAFIVETSGLFNQEIHNKIADLLGENCKGFNSNKEII